MTRLIFHHPLPVNPEGDSGSSVRPYQMLTAFESLAEVWPVTGDSTERASAIREIKAAMRRGVHFDLVYSESTNLPTMLTDPDRIPRQPVLDPAFLRTCRREGIPIGLFYRDIHWRFPGFAESRSPLARAAGAALYHFDLSWYRRYVDILYVPSMPMWRHVPMRSGIEVQELPPGTLVSAAAAPPAEGPLEVIYAGGLGYLYDIRAFVEALGKVSGLHLTLCTREEEWREQSSIYEPLLGDNTSVVHLFGSELAQQLDQSHLTTNCVGPHPYREFAVPVKLYEGIGRGIPQVVTKGTYQAEVVDRLGLGWSVAYDVASIRELFTHLVAHRDEIVAARERTLAQRDEHTWLARAEQVIRELGAVRGN